MALMILLDHRGHVGAGHLQAVRTRNQQRVRWLLEIEFFEERFAQRIKRLQDGVADQLLLLVGNLRRRARIEGLQNPAHIVQRRIRVKSD